MEHLNGFRPELESDMNSFNRQIFRDERTDKKIHQHLTDENDMITDADLENIKTEMTPATEMEEKAAAKRAGFTEEEMGL